MLILRTFPVIGQVSIRMGGTASRPFESSPSLGRGLSLRNSPQGRDQRVLAESLAKGRVAVMMGLTYYSFAPFIKAGLPIKSLPPLKEGTYGTAGSGNLAIVKNPAHPNATKVFVNWVLSREGQEIVSKALGQATRRLDVDTKWLREGGVIAAKDQISVQEYLKIENQSEEKLDKVREPALKVAQALLN